MHALAAVLLVGILTTCRSETALAPVFIQPELSVLDIFGAVQDGGVLIIHAQTLDTSVHVSARQRVWIEVRAGSGDVEQVDLERAVCGGTRYCAEFYVGMRDGRQIDEILPSMSSLPARIVTVFSDRKWGAGRVWHNDDLARVMGALRRRPGVEQVDQGGFGCADVCLSVNSRLSAARPLEDRAPRHNNGWIEARVGDTITVTYSQPSGATLSDQVVMKAVR